jgi:hypothetical protein
MYSSKNILEVYLIKYFRVKNGVFGDFKSISAANRPFLAPFLDISGGMGNYLPPNSLHHHPLPGHSPRQ